MHFRVSLPRPACFVFWLDHLIRPAANESNSHRSETAPSSSDQVEDQNDQCYDQEDVNKAASNMKAESQQPQNQKDYKDSPEHRYPLSA